MSNNWQQSAIIAAGGTVFDIAHDASGRVWLSTEAGIFNNRAETWRPLAQGQPLSQLNALGCADTVLFAGSGYGQIVYSTDGGQHWYQGRVGQTSEPIICFAAAPNFRQKGVVLAGTDGAGILRSTDGGRNWQLANFGLQDFSVMALATSPAWERRELAFAATTRGFYRSPNGGRAWKKAEAGLEGADPQAIAVSPNFARDRTVLVGTESRGVFRSTDSGKIWQAWGQGLTSADADDARQGNLPPVNSLWLHPDFATTPICVAGTGDGQLFYSANGGETWQRVATADGAVLCLGGTEQELYAGLHNQGLLRSTDGGQTWTQVLDLAARAIIRLLSDDDDNLFASGPLEGGWRSADGGQTWTQLPGLAEEMPLLTLAASPPVEAPAPKVEPCLLAATSAGLFRTSDEGQTWQNVLSGEEVVTICFSPHFAADGQVWVGTGAGNLLASVDGGLTWNSRQSPKPGLPLVALAALALPPKEGQDTLAAVTFTPDKRQMTLWRSPNGGTTWQQWQQAGAEWPSAHVSVVGPDEGRVIVCFDRRCWVTSAAGWERVLEMDRPIVRLSRLAGDKGLLAMTSQQLLYSPDGVAWSAWDEGLAGQTLQDLALGSVSEEGQAVYIVTTGGAVWRRSKGTG